MKNSALLRWFAVATAVSASLLTCGAAIASTTVTAASGTMTVASDPGDSVGLGGQFSFAAPASTFLMWGDGHQVQVVIRGPNFPAASSDSWIADFAAPTGQSLTAGSYAGTTYPFEASQDAGLRIEGLSGCSAAVGTFEVSNISWGPFNYLQSVDLSFVQYCNGSAAAARGELHLVAPAAPAPLQITYTVNGNNGILRPDGSATVQGTVTCTQSANISIDGQLTQQLNNKRTASGFFQVGLDHPCGPSASPWQATISSSTGFGFTNAPATIHVATATLDPFYTAYTGNNIPVLATLDAVTMLAPGNRNGQN